MKSEGIEVQRNDAWSVKLKAGVELKETVPLEATEKQQLKGSLDTACEYELADLNESEYTKSKVVNRDYYKLSKPEEEKETFRTKSSFGVEVEDKYGIFITGEYRTGGGSKEDYRAGRTLKATF